MNKRYLVAASLAAVSFLTIPGVAQDASPATAPRAPRPQGPPPAPYNGNRPQSIENGVQIQTPFREDVIAMEDAIPTKAMVTPKQPRKVLVLATAKGFVHSSLPLAAETVKLMGEKTGAYTATITFDPADINTANLAKYDAVFLASTTGEFLDDKNDPAATEARRAALLSFVRDGKGLAGIHAAIDSYHTNGRDPAGLKGTWPEFNKMVGGYFKFHWIYPQEITVKIDDPKSPLNSMFHGEYVYHDETYTMAQDSFSRKNVHVLTSVDYAKMSDEDKAKETAATKRTDGDYALSWIRREGKGRVFMDVVGHSEHIYSMPHEMEHVLAGIQYALGDLKADDAPSVK